MKTVLTVIWLLFLNSNIHRRDLSIGIEKPPCAYSLPLVIDLIQANLVLARAYFMNQCLVMFLISLAVIICWTKFLSLFEKL